MRRAAAFASCLGVLVLVLACQPAKAQDLTQTFPFLSRHPKVDQRVANVGLGAGAVSTAAYFAIKEGSGLDWGAWGIATAGCVVLAPMIAAVLTPERELTRREVMVMQGSCLIPVVGGILVNALFDANPQWERDQPVRVRRAAVRR